MKYNIKTPLGEILGQCDDCGYVIKEGKRTIYISKDDIKFLGLTIEPIKKIEAWAVVKEGGVSLFNDYSNANKYAMSNQRIVHLVEAEEQ